MRARPELQRETFGSTRVIVHAIELQGDGAVRLDKARRRVRLQTKAELVRAEAEKLVAVTAPQGAVQLTMLLTAPALKESLSSMSEVAAADFAKEALASEESTVSIEGSCLRGRPRATQMRRVAETLFSDEHLVQDARLRAKIAESPSGEVPLTWLCGRYIERFGAAPPSCARAAEVTAAELCEALAQSAALRVDPRRLTVQRRVAAVQATVQAAAREVTAADPAPAAPCPAGKLTPSPPGTFASHAAADAAAQKKVRGTPGEDRVPEDLGREAPSSRGSPSEETGRRPLPRAAALPELRCSSGSSWTSVVTFRTPVPAQDNL